MLMMRAYWGRSLPAAGEIAPSNRVVLHLPDRVGAEQTGTREQQTLKSWTVVDLAVGLQES